MTIIVVRNGIVASDTMAQSGSGWILPERCQKIWTTPWGVAGIVGTISAIDAIREWTCAETALEGPKLDDDTQVIEFREDGVFVTEAGGTSRQPMALGFYAWGSGRAPAFGALHAGVDARRAVEIAMLVDPQCGGDILELRLGETD